MTTEPTEIELFDEKANEIFQAFLESMQGDPKFVRPVTESDKDDFVDEDWTFVYTYRGQHLCERMLSRLSRLAEKKFGADCIDVDINSHLYREY